MSLVYLILGGNRGNSKEIFSDVIDLITRQIGPHLAISALYESESWGFVSELFMNQVIKIETHLTPTDILPITQKIETTFGRVRSGGGYEARTIDIDLLYYDSLIINTPDLIIPHPRIAQRRFVLVPLNEIAPDLTDPVTGMTVQAMLEKCQDKLMVRRVK